MNKATSPLRYPGGKSCLEPLIVQLLKLNKLERCHYVEPYAGGCGLALALLFDGYVSDIHVNDLDPAIWCFWHSVLEHNKELVSLINSTPITIEEWHKQKAIQIEANVSNPVELGFSTFFLNRTNRSGIIKKAGPIGGKNQDGNYKIDCRFNKENLIERIERIHKYKSQINLYNLDAVDFMNNPKNIPDRSFFCIDPPYFKQGSRLYTSSYEPSDHQQVAESILSLDHPWIVTYDNADEIKKHYAGKRQFLFDLNYSVQVKRVGNELLIASKGLRISPELNERQLPKTRKSNVCV